MQATSETSDIALHTDTLKDPWFRAGLVDKMGNSFVTWLGEDAFPLFFFIKTFIIRKDAWKNPNRPFFFFFFAVPSRYLIGHVMVQTLMDIWCGHNEIMTSEKQLSRGRKGWKDHQHAKFKLSITIWVEMYFYGICCILFFKHTLDWGRLSIY